MSPREGPLGPVSHIWLHCALGVNLERFGTFGGRLRSDGWHRCTSWRTPIDDPLSELMFSAIGVYVSLAWDVGKMTGLVVP